MTFNFDSLFAPPSLSESKLFCNSPHVSSMQRYLNARSLRIDLSDNLFLKETADSWCSFHPCRVFYLRALSTGSPVDSDDVRLIEDYN